MYDEYTKYPLITKQRMFYETMEDVLPGLKIVISGGEGGDVEKILPLDSFAADDDTTDNTDSTKEEE